MCRRGVPVDRKRAAPGLAGRLAAQDEKNSGRGARMERARPRSAALDNVEQDLVLRFEDTLGREGKQQSQGKCSTQAATGGITCCWGATCDRA